MKTPPTQFDVRENTASSRQHDLRLATDARSKLIRTDGQDLDPHISPPENDFQATDSENQLHAAPPHAATVERTGIQLLTIRELAEMLQVPVSWVYGRMRKRCADRIPGFRLGKYWRFSEQDVTAWLQAKRTKDYHNAGHSR
jgi:excisionase family DNA binding protein